MFTTTIRLACIRLAWAALALTSATTAQALVRDINRVPTDSRPGSQPRPLAIAQNGELLLSVYTPESGHELWISDGTGVGTRLLRDIDPGWNGSSPANCVRLASGIVLFTAQTAATGTELWRTDGTAAGTFLVRDLRPGTAGSAPRHLTAIGNVAVFFANDGLHGFEAWRSDGTAAGTSMIADATPGPAPVTAPLTMVRLGSNAIHPGFAGVWELRRIDPTNTTFQVVATLPTAASSPLSLVTIGTRAVMVVPQSLGARELWVTDGTGAGTQWLGAFSGDDLFAAGGRVFFVGVDSELWATDGTPAGTGLVADVTPAVGAFSSVQILGSLGNEIVFTGGRPNGRLLYLSDGTAAGTRAVTPMEQAPFLTTAEFGGRLWFNGTQGSTQGLFCTDGTAAGTRNVSPVLAQGMLGFGGALLFGGADATVGDELWRTDGTAAGTTLVADIYRANTTQDGVSKVIGSHGDEALLIASDGGPHTIWRSNGTAPGTAPLPGAFGVFAGFAEMASAPSFALLALPGVGSTGVWTYRSTPPTLASLDPGSAYPGFAIGLDRPVALEHRIVFTARDDASGNEPWITDGTPGGTTRIADIQAGTGNGTLGNYLEWRGRVWFLGETTTNGREPWSTDGTAAGTSMLLDTVPGSGGIGLLDWHATDARLWFRAFSTSLGDTLWSTDGTQQGTTQFDLSALGLDGAYYMTTVGNRLLFTSWDGSQYRAVSTDGTVAGTVLLPAQITPNRVTSVGRDRAVISVAGLGTVQLWITDGTLAGTSNAGSLSGTSFGSNRTWRVTDDQLLLSRDSPLLGKELFVSDGTAAGTSLLFDLGPLSSDPADVVRLGDRVLYSANDGEHGRELFVFDVTRMRDEIAEPFGFGCPAPGTLPPTLRVDGEADASAGSFDLAVYTPPNAPVLLATSDRPGATEVGGCTLFVGGTPTVVATTSSAAGRAAVTLPVTPALFGLRFVAQAFAIEPNGPLFGLATASRGLEVVLGP